MQAQKHGASFTSFRHITETLSGTGRTAVCAEKAPFQVVRKKTRAWIIRAWKEFRCAAWCALTV
jgi:hypothetical protein